jgi:peptidyl-prolyl cis-trans isomerase D
VGPNAQRVNWNDAQSTTDLVNAIVEPKLLEADAEKQGFFKAAQKDPDVQREKRQAVVRLLEKEEITDKINPTGDDERRFYESHLADFIQPEMRTIREIFIKEDSAKAVQVRAQALKGGDFRKLAQRYNEKESTRPDTGRLGPFDEKRFGLIGKTAFALAKPGDISAVIPIGKNFSVVALLEVIPSRTKTFEEAAVDAKRLTRQALTDERQKALEKELLDKYKLTVDGKVLASAWPLPEGASQDKITREP